MSHCITESSEHGQGSLDVRHPSSVPHSSRTMCLGDYIKRLKKKKKATLTIFLFKIGTSPSSKPQSCVCRCLLHVVYVPQLPISWPWQWVITRRNRGSSRTFLSSRFRISNFSLAFQSRCIWDFWRKERNLPNPTRGRFFSLPFAGTPHQESNSARRLISTFTFNIWLEFINRGAEDVTGTCYVTSWGARQNKSVLFPIQISSGLPNTKILYKCSVCVDIYNVCICMCKNIFF